mmetsp:Transcript_35939/g.65988  ORF Transcript_35939/g.65988 Transcript_35939/m.65988 type:complete len:319 (+) Transcript_35939:89-1045(+)
MASLTGASPSAGSSTKRTLSVIDLCSDEDEAASPCNTTQAKLLRRSSCTEGVRPRKLDSEFIDARETDNLLVFNTHEVTCSICLDDVPAWTALELTCGHSWFCAVCLRKHSAARAELGDPVVKCPCCTALLSHAVLRAVLPPDLYDRLLNGSLETAVGASAELWACPTPDCPNRVAVSEGETLRLDCSFCGKEHCLQCHAHPYHHGKTCEEHAAEQSANTAARESEAQLKKWMRETGSCRCPKCGAGISKANLDEQQSEKLECHKMVCRVCRTRFCFHCLAILTSSYTCGCTGDNHGFIDPTNGGFLVHLDRHRGGRR